MLEILKIKLFSIKNLIKNLSLIDEIKMSIGIIMGLGFLWALYLGFYRVLIYIQTLPLIGPLLLYKFLAITFMASFIMIVFSGIINSFSTIFYSSDLFFLMSCPIKFYKIFAVKMLETVIQSSWMILITLIPFFIAFANVKSAGIDFFITLAVLLAPFMFIATSIGVLFSLLIMHFFPSSKTRDIVMILIIFIGSIGYMLIRFIEPEKLSDPDIFYDTMQYIAYLNAPVAAYLPSWWLTEAVNSAIQKKYTGLFLNGMLLLAVTIVIALLLGYISEKLYYRGWAGAQINQFTLKKRKYAILSGISGSKLLNFIYKDIMMFIRDIKQWSQILLVLALTAVYLFSIYKLPVQFNKSPGIKFTQQYISDFIGFINIGGIGFILAALSLRFVYPQLSLERGSIWFMLSIPATTKEIIKSKLLVSIIPITLLGLFLVCCSNIILKVSAELFIISAISMLVLSAGITTLALGLGLVYPKFNIENVAQIETSYGGILYVVISLIYIGLTLVILAKPTMDIARFHTLKNSLYNIIEYILLNGIVLIYPVWKGNKSLKEIEFNEW